MKRLLTLTLLYISLVSCSHNINSDNEIPVIEPGSLKIINLDSVNKFEFYVGTNIQFSANFIDNQELGSYKFDIHFAGDGHKHPNDYNENLIKSKLQWDFTRNGEINGTEKKIVFNNKIELKDDKGIVLHDEATAGPYHCVVYAVDEAGNSAVFVKSKFLIVNDEMPVYTITEPDFTDLKVAAGATMNIKGLAYGRRGLSKLAYIIRSVDDESADDLLHYSEQVKGNIKEVDIDLPIVIPSYSPAGNYILLLLASDQTGNVGEYFESFEITNSL